MRLNLSKTGMSVSIGKRGLNLNIKGDQVTENIGLPGIGLGYQEKISPKIGEQPIQIKQADQQESSRANRALISLVLLVLLAMLYVYLQTCGAL
ncbi:MAG: DUF4236 domain-containing protein [Polynucleobacter sp.]|nr:DUF4236 domain-containing protein [Polynucleobacter sp.]MDO8713236.1 DUF4236 domain-containing protein [Polynucleobacter sp.]